MTKLEPELCTHCGKTLHIYHGRFARCSGGETQFTPPSHNIRHNTPSELLEVERDNSLLPKDAPGETRTPNLLIRSHSPSKPQPPPVAVLRTQARPVTATQIPKRDTSSQNNSHNSSWEVLYSGSRPLALCGGWTV